MSMFDFTVEFDGEDRTSGARFIGMDYSDELNPKRTVIELNETEAHAFDLFFSAFLGRQCVRELLHGVADEGFAEGWDMPEGTENVTPEELHGFIESLLAGGVFDEAIAEFVAGA